jgi:Ser/Thr protein kinase RdoA (MazF antagonist)
VLDFNAARLDLRVFDVILATFWFAWRKGSLDLERAMAFQNGYAERQRLSDGEVALASEVFRWLMGRSIAERLRTHYLDERLLRGDAAGLERFYQMCLWAAGHSLELTAGLRSEDPQ